MIKWTNRNVSFHRGNCRCVIAKFDNSNYWFDVHFSCWTGLQRDIFKEVGTLYGSTTCEIKYMLDDDSIEFSEPVNNIITIVQLDSGFRFRQELDVPEGTLRQFKYFKPEDIFK